ncbi:hypothetical protein NYY90_20410, partial [Acinetobacter baumannii]|nr:hypothetical protein [Acinetobacter baumannii]
MQIFPYSYTYLIVPMNLNAVGLRTFDIILCDMPHKCALVQNSVAAYSKYGYFAHTIYSALLPCIALLA